LPRGLLNAKEKKILIVAGEASGDLHGSGVVKALQEIVPSLQVCAMGGDRMRKAGAEILVDSSELAVVGITEVLGRIHGLLNAYWRLRKFLQSGRVNLLILIDFPDFNLPLAEASRKAGIPVLYYISPQIWAWRSGRIQKIARRVQKMAVIFSFEKAIFEKVGVDVEFVSHPLLDVLSWGEAESAAVDFLEVPKRHPVIALLPGSRAREVQTLLPEMIRAAERIRRRKPDAQFIVAAAPTVEGTQIDKMVPGGLKNFKVIRGKTYEAIRAADLVIVASGTATLETAILGKPMVILYQVSPLSYWIGKALVKVNCVGMVNIVAGRKVVQELLQKEARADRITAEALRILEDERYRNEMIRALEEVRQKLGTPGAARRVAHMALEMIASRQASMAG
jgi:lipid-A-disaccharide synthase